MDQHESMYSCKPKEFTSPLEKGDHPDIDTAEELNEEDIKRYQTMIAFLQWAVSSGRFDTQTTIMIMSRCRIAPRIGHLSRLKIIYGYLKKLKCAAIRVRIVEPDLSNLPDQEFEWCHTVYSNVKELLPKDAPKPLGKAVTPVTYTDANLYHHMLTGRSVTGIRHFSNHTLVDWYCKR
jgi:hypothetical protein